MKIGRNDPCLCGSRKKYKKCCLNKREITKEKLPYYEEQNYSRSKKVKNILKNSMVKAISKSKKNKFKCFESKCQKTAINSHSQSLSNSLKNIAENGHLIKCAPQFFIKENDSIDDIFFQKIGINIASTFKGFCNMHDGQYFKNVDIISKENFNKKILTELSFRTFAYEERIKEKMYGILDFVIRECSNYIDLEPMQLTCKGIKNHLNLTKPYYMKKYIEVFKSQDYKDIYGLVFILNKTLPISCSTSFNPTFINNSMDVAKINIDKPVDLIFFTIIPQCNNTLVIFTCFKEQKKLLESFIKTISTIENIVFNHCEEVLMNPTFYYSLSYKLKRNIINGLRGWAFWERQYFPDLFKVKLESPVYI